MTRPFNAQFNMEKVNELLDTIAFWFKDFNRPDNWYQLLILFLALGLAWLISHKLSQRFALGGEYGDVKRLKKFTLRSLERLLFPLSALVVVALARLGFHLFDQPAFILNIAVPLLISLAAIRFIVYILRKSFTPSPALKAWENIISTTVWIVVALHLVGVLPAVLSTLDAAAFKLGETRISLLAIIKFVLLIAALFTLAFWLSANIERRLHGARHISASVQVGMAKFAKFVLIVIALFVALDAVGIDLTALTVFGGALGVGLGFGLQRIASNFISGFLLLFDRSIKPGDVIHIGERFGWVQELRARYIVVKDRDGVETLIPNENLITTDVVNWSYSDRNVRVKLPISVSYHDDPQQAMDLMVAAANAHARVLKDPEPVARLLQFGDNGIHLELRIWINDPERGVNNVRSDLNLAMFNAFNDAGITIPFPQRDVYVKELPPRNED